MAITGLYLEPDTAPYTSTTLSISSNLTDSDRFTSATGNYWYTHYSYGIDFGVATTISKLVMYGNTASSTPTGWYTTSYDSFKVFKSDDNATWTHVDDFDGPPLIYLAALQWGFELIFTQSSQTARYFKVVYIDTSTAAFASGGISARIGEVEYVELTGWNSNNKLKLIIDSSKVDSDLTNFPVLITLSSGTGITGFDATPVFDELSTISGTKKIAITDANDNQLYTEIERWDWGNEEANLWVKVPTISSGTDTNLYLYYDSTQPDNVTYVGDTGDTPAKSVWDANFVGVWHMAQDPSIGGACILDSTSNVRHQTPTSMDATNLVDSAIGKGLYFDGVNDCIISGNSDLSALRINFTITFFAKFGAATGGYDFAVTVGGASHGQIQNGAWHDSDNFSLGVGYDGVQVTDLDVDRGNYHLFSQTLDSSVMYAYKDIAKSAITNMVTIEDLSNDQIGFGGNAVNRGQITIAEARISKIVRSDVWLKATYYSNWNDFITFEDYVPLITTFIFSSPSPTDLSTVYGTTQQLYLTTTVTGLEVSYTYNADFYNAYDDSLINTSSGVQGGQPAGAIMNTVSGINYQWYVTATSSGYNDTSDTYTFINRFLCEGQTQINDVPASGIPVRLYRRSTGEYIGGVISSGVSGTFEIETTHNDYHFVVANYFNENTNAIIVDFLKP